jgi:hypothetical protein
MALGSMHIDTAKLSKRIKIIEQWLKIAKTPLHYSSGVFVT